MSSASVTSVDKAKSLLKVTGPFLSVHAIEADELVTNHVFDWKINGKNNEEGKTSDLCGLLQTELKDALTVGGFTLHDVHDVIVFDVALELIGKVKLRGKTDAAIARISADSQCSTKDLISVSVLIFEFKVKLYNESKTRSRTLVSGVEQQAISELLAFDKASKYGGTVVCLTDASCFRFYTLQKLPRGGATILVCEFNSWQEAIPYIRTLLQSTPRESTLSTIEEGLEEDDGRNKGVESKGMPPPGKSAEDEEGDKSDTSHSDSSSTTQQNSNAGESSSTQQEQDICCDPQAMLSTLPDLLRDQLSFASHRTILREFKSYRNKVWREAHPEWMGLTVTVK
jgi:hypothetical protein